MEAMRINGFKSPLHPLQVVSWVVFGLDVVAYLIIFMPMIETLAAKVAVAISFVLSVVVLVTATFIATSRNPVDPFVLREESEFKDEELDELPYCGLCNSPVQARSKHCRACNKCVADFDHHCMWLNNCIGGINYRAFFISICSVAVMIGIVLSTMLYQFIDYATNQDTFAARLEASLLLSGLSSEGFLGILIAMSFVNVPLWVLDMQLVILHAFLMHQNMTTYEYIMNKNAATEQREMEQLEAAMEQGENGRKRFKALPRCMDWIIFSKCGQRRRKKTNNIERIDESKAPKKTGDAGVEAAAAAGTGSHAAQPVGESERTGAEQRAARAPPGYTAESDGSPGSNSPRQKAKIQEEAVPEGDADTEQAASSSSPHAPAAAQLQILSVDRQRGEAEREAPGEDRAIVDGEEASSSQKGGSPQGGLAAVAGVSCGCDGAPHRCSTAGQASAAL
eukprot:gb/GFBE01041226.1/.p1 GENE.gb/GFBE01041226.1/~~gb/GFBE01041226.1/.p1  ORF type:complete len:451 (+),score=96.52 gb/GFBE01041226.1/:1-1353(+)